MGGEWLPPVLLLAGIWGLTWFFCWSMKRHMNRQFERRRGFWYDLGRRK